ncbi:MAG: hypothetical protein A2W90_21425 [Bacteroidetes bacterium GWF2_42_66]|nr:MAG: hypothetical protein A2W92_06450 [Bacteroidetes bacterium GWA2_42_15]OFX98895.1 MAG: hypothetical protein A2W89_13060 [Bacteroidetes bacterium GWE2_42_39]OFY45610.1 MAG: hypothetical protein A2W90_21425 [Bacteroidetes bacterium GWF2_42_66]HBL77410.1 DoxX family protein [Prolixibacteraceae bacterium]HCU62426.1 DoxX family protein [Prolixibacteraceae bacterium]
MKIVQQLTRILLGITFVFSGFVKGIDPWGSAYKFTDYFTSFGWDSLVNLAFPLGILLAAAEFAIGVALIFKLWMRFTSWVALLFMAFFTALTLYIAITNPVTDCGCFGDALVLTNWQTFYKNLVFIGLAIFIFRNRTKYENKDGMILPLVFSGMTLIVYFYFVDYSYNHLPLIDFRPYKVGTNIPEAMQIPEGAPKDVYKTIFKYKNKETGKIKTFTEENYPWQDTLLWEYVSMESKLVKAGYKAPIHDFRMESEGGEDVKDFFLYDEGYTFILVAYNLLKTNREAMQKVNELAKHASANNMQFIGMTSSARDEINSFVTETGASFEFFNCDEITLKTIIRSNPGLLLLKKGTIIAKWHYNDIPDDKKLKEVIEE